MKLFFIIIMFVLVGCATGYRWNKVGATQQQFEQETYQCQQETRSRYSSGYGSTYSSAEYSDPELYMACMRARCYTYMGNK